MSQGYFFHQLSLSCTLCLTLNSSSPPPIAVQKSPSVSPGLSRAKKIENQGEKLGSEGKNLGKGAENLGTEWRNVEMKRGNLKEKKKNLKEKELWKEKVGNLGNEVEDLEIKRKAEKVEH